MRSIGIRQLRQRTSAYLRLVEAGETIEVTDHGRPVALLVPVPTDDALKRLTSQGRLSEVAADLLELGEPLEASSGVHTPSQTLAAMRAGER